MSAQRVTDYDVVLLDAMIINNFAEAGAHRALVTYLGARIATSTIVAAECSDARHITEPRRFILQAIEAHGALIEPTGEEIRRIDHITTPEVPGGRRRDRGEASLVVCAHSMTGSKVIVLDDRAGAPLAHSNKLDTASGRRLMTEMIMEGAADSGHSWRMAQRCFQERSRSRHDQQLEGALQRLKRELGTSG